MYFKSLIIMLLSLISVTLLASTVVQGKGQEYQLTFPEVWHVQTNYSDDIDLLARDGEMSKLMYVHIDMSPPLSSKGLLLNSITDLMNRYPLVKIVAQGEELFEGHPVEWVVYTNTIANENIEVMEYYFLGDLHGYVIGILTTPQNFNEVQNLFRHLVHSFHLSKK